MYFFFVERRVDEYVGSCGPVVNLLSACVICCFARTPWSPVAGPVGHLIDFSDNVIDCMLSYITVSHVMYVVIIIIFLPRIVKHFTSKAQLFSKRPA